MQHRVYILDNLDGDYRLLAERNFARQFSPAAYRWFAAVVQRHIAALPTPAIMQRVGDTTLATFHYNVNGNTYELR